MKNKLAPSSICDEETLKRCRDVLNKWSRALPFARVHCLGDDGVFVAATMYHYYSFDIATDIVQRKFQLLPGGNPTMSAKDISKYDAWERPESPEDGALDVVLEETAHRVICEACHGDGKFQCPKCHGEGQYTCTSCDGSGHSACFHCWGRGYKTKKRVVGCTSCNGTGRKEKLFGGYKTCGRCNGSGNITEKYEETCSRCGGSGHVDCDTCNATGIEVCSKCTGEGVLYCNDCEGRGWNPFVWHFIQTPAKEVHGGTWCDEGIPGVFQFLRDVGAEKRSLSCKKTEKRIGKDAVVGFEAPFMSELQAVWDEHDAKSMTYDSSRIWHEEYDFIEYDALVKYEYTYMGKSYQAWKDLACEKVFETQGTGLFLEQADDMACIADRRPWYRPQTAISEYARACAFAAGNRGAIEQYSSRIRRRLGLISWIFRLASVGVAGCLWSQYLQTCGIEPYFGWTVVGGLAMVDMLFAHRNAWMSVAGIVVLLALGQCARELYLSLGPSCDIGLMRYLGECALLFSGLTLVFSRDLCLRVRGGLLVPLVSGLAIGFISAPNGVLDFADDSEQMAMWLMCVVSCVWAIAFTRTISRIWVQGGWMATVSSGPRLIRWQTNRLRPSWLLSILWLVMLIAGYCAYEKYAGRGVPMDQQMKGAERLLASPESVKRGQMYLQCLAKGGYAPSMSRIGELQLYGLCGFAKDEMSGYEWAVAASEKGDVNGCRIVGWCLEFGHGTDQDLARALLSYRKGADAGDETCRESAERIRIVGECWAGAHNGNSEHEYDLAICYMRGMGVAANAALARKWLLKSAEAGLVKAQLLASNWLKDGVCGGKDVPLAAKLCLKAAESGTAESLLMAGLYSAEGLGLPKDDGKALSYFEEASEKHCCDAMYMMGCFYRDGRGGPRFPDKAYAVFERAGKCGFLPAKYALGKCFEEGIGVATNYTAALAQYKASTIEEWVAPDKKVAKKDADAAAQKLIVLGENWEAAQNGDPIAQDAVGMCFALGEGVGVDKTRAYEWYVKSAAKNHDKAIIHVGNALFAGEGVAEDKSAAAQAYLRVKDMSDAIACYNFAKCYEQGIGVDRNLTQAYGLFAKSAEMGKASAKDAAAHIEIPAKCWDRAIQGREAGAQYELAECFRDGDKGINKDVEKAFEFFNKSANQGHGPAMYELAICYRDGLGTATNENLMKTWLMRSVKRGWPKALDLAADMLCQGDVYPRNYTTAYQYYEKALAGGVVTAGVKMRKIDELAKWWEAAHAGNADAQYHLGRCYWKGVQVDTNEAAALEWLEKAVAQGQHDAEYVVSVITDAHRQGKNNETLDKRVVSLLQKAASSGNKDAKVLLAKYVYNGWGIDDDVDQAVKTWTDCDTPEAQYYLGEHYWTGTGLFRWGKNRDKAKQCWRKASAGGYAPADECLRKVNQD